MNAQDLVGTRKGNLTCTKAYGGITIEFTCDCGVSFDSERRHLSDKSSMIDCGCRMTGIEKGDVYGQWTVTGRMGTKTVGQRMRVSMVCECGKEDSMAMTALRGGKRPACFCKRGEDHIGERHFLVTIISHTLERRNGCIVYNVKCDCGTMFKTTRTSLVRGNTTSCGCRQKMIASARGKAGMPTSAKFGYVHAHKLVIKSFGDAADHTCLRCAKVPAEQWAYDHLDPDEVVSDTTHKGLVFSRKLSHYVALCVPCHVAFDVAFRSGVIMELPEAVYEVVDTSDKVDGRKTPRKGTAREFKRQLTVAKKKRTQLTKDYIDELVALEVKISGLEQALALSTK